MHHPLRDTVHMPKRSHNHSFFQKYKIKISIRNVEERFFPAANGNIFWGLQIQSLETQWITAQLCCFTC